VAHNEILVEASAEDTFRVLADPRCYGIWVVGSSEIRRADPNWPASGTVFHHTVGVRPLRIADHTEVLAADPPRSLELLAHARPLPPARVKLVLRSEGRGTRVLMHEDLEPPLLRILLWPITQVAIKLRNAESLRRLKGLAEGTIPWPTGPMAERSRAE
jgi:Polyketide cyclase / dehydrase and lipid transport